MGWWTQTKITAMERSAAALEWMARRRGRWPTGPPHLATGLEGEKVGFFYLMRNGYTVVARRWSSNRVRGDLDLIAWQGQTLCIVEVKTRRPTTLFQRSLASIQARGQCFAGLHANTCAGYLERPFPTFASTYSACISFRAARKRLFTSKMRLAGAKDAGSGTNQYSLTRPGGSSTLGVLKLFVPRHLNCFEPRLVRLCRIIGKAR